MKSLWEAIARMVECFVKNGYPHHGLAVVIAVLATIVIAVVR